MEKADILAVLGRRLTLEIHFKSGTMVTCADT